MATATFFDPYLAELSRQLQHEQTTGVADLQLQQQRLTEDANLMRPYMERRFSEQMDRRAGSIAGRGFHGGQSGVMRSGIGDLAEDQAFTAGQFERKTARGSEDIERAILELTSRTTREGAEGVRQGASNATQRSISSLPF